MRYIVIISISILLLSGLAFAQEDTLILLGSTEAGGYAVSAYDKHAFLADGGIRVINYSDLRNPDTVTRYTEPAHDIDIRENLAYYVGDSLYIRDISKPLESRQIGSCCHWGYSFRVHVFDTLALVTHTTAPQIVILRIIDISDPTHPRILSTNYPTGDGWWARMDVWKKDNYVYWVDWASDPETGCDVGQITVLDITDPTDPIPIVVDTCLPRAPTAIWIKDNYAYVSLDDYFAGPEVFNGGLIVLDVSDPYNIDSLGFFEVPREAYNIYIKGNFAYISAHLSFFEGDGIYVLDITDPTNPTLVTYYDTPGTPMDVLVDEPYVLVAEYSSLLVFEASFLSVPGDVNSDGIVNSSDIVYLIDYLFKNGPEPSDLSAADVNFDCLINAADIVYLIDYLFRGGPRPQYGCVS